jgi:hypothetical protein
MGTGNLKWIKIEARDTAYIIEIPYGLNKANFKDSDFQISECKKVVVNAEDKVVTPI